MTEAERERVAQFGIVSEGSEFMGDTQSYKMQGGKWVPVEAYQSPAEQERAAVVAWLRESAALAFGVYAKTPYAALRTQADAFDTAARLIEAREHLKDMQQ